MAFAATPIPYCTNVHPANTFAELLANLERYAVPLADHFGRPFDVGLWMPRSVLATVAPRSRTDELAKWLHRRGLICTTMNAFPFGDFHAARVKEEVFQPAWHFAARSDYTCRAGDLLARLLPADGEGSISTCPLNHKSLHPEGAPNTIYCALIEPAHLAWIKRRREK